jgi:hypothetical protein
MTDEVDAMLEEYFEVPEEITMASGTPLEKSIKKHMPFAFD